MTNKIEISRELAVERLTEIANRDSAVSVTVRAEDLRALLAAPAVERQDVLPCDVRVAPATTIKKGCKVETMMQCIELRKGQPDKFTRFENSGPPAPVAVTLPERRVPDQDGFDADHYSYGWNACLDKVKEMNQ